MTLPLPMTALDALMPLNIVFGADWRVAHTGPTLRKLAGGVDLTGHTLGEVFMIGSSRPAVLDTNRKRPIHLTLCHGLRPRLQGSVQDLGDQAGGAKLLNLSLHFTEWTRDSGANLIASDFAPGDLVNDVVFLIEARTLVMGEAIRLIGSLRGQAITAEELAGTDTLTGLQNRRSLDFAIARLTDRGIPFALTHLDLDYFKAVNDTHGHAAGDAVLRHVATVLTEVTRKSDTVARIGGDEFVLLLADMTEPGQIDGIARRIIKRIEMPVNFNGKECRVSTSLGTTVSTNYSTPDLALMMADADRALYASKAAGRAAHTFWPPQPAESR